MKKLFLFGAALLMLGLGCQTTTNQIPPQDSTPAPTPTTVNTTTPDTALQELSLTAEAIGNREVKFTWTAPAGLTEANRFILVQGIEENPVHDGKHIWIRQFYTNRTATWRELSPGPVHVRICLTENNNHDVCTKYSNDVFVEVR